MFEQTLETSATPHIIITECVRTLRITGSEAQLLVLTADGNAEDVTLDQADETFTLAAQVACSLACPANTTLTIEKVGGNLRVRDIRGRTTISDVYGNTRLRGVGSTTIEQTQGNLSVQDLPGTLRVNNVGGNARVRRVGGQCSLDYVGGNLRAQRLEGNLESRQVRGNARIGQVEGSCSLNHVNGNLTVQHVGGELSGKEMRGNANITRVDGACCLDHVYGNLAARELEGGLTIADIGGNTRLASSFASGATYQLSANGNIDIHLREGANVRLTLRAVGGVHSHIQSLALEDADGQTAGTLGAGDASLDAQAGGAIHLHPGAAEDASTHGQAFRSFTDSDDLSATIQARVDETVAEIQSRVMEGLRFVDGEKIQQQMDRIGDRTRKSAERVAERAQRSAERGAERARMRQERAERRWRRVSGQRPQPKRSPATGEEQMRVLHMVEEGKLTPEQAADLLDALEGR